MKALTLTQPWATLVAIGAKRVETRIWSTKYRGPLAIHAAKNFPKSAIALCVQEPFRHALLEPGESDLSLDENFLPQGHVIATCNLIECFKVKNYRENYFPVGGHYFHLPPDEPELSFGDYAPGRFAWILGNVEMLPEPIPAKGALGLWEWTEEKKDEA